MATKVYLDLCKWVDLARAEADHKSGLPFKDALTVAKAGVAMGLASFPLSAQHYMETSARNRAASRYKVAGLMMQLSSGQVMAGLEAIVPCEIDRSLNRLFGRPRQPRTCQIFGLSIFEALGHPEWKYSPPEWVQLTPGQDEALETLTRYFLLAASNDVRKPCTIGFYRHPAWT